MPLFLGKDGFWTAGYTRLRFEDIKKRDVVRFIQDQRYAVVADDSLSAILIGPERVRVQRPRQERAGPVITGKQQKRENGVCTCL